MFELRPFQLAVLSAFSSGDGSGRHVIGVAPTGSGKSLIYERIASRAGIRMLLVTPLVALARQQAERLRSQGISVALGASLKSHTAFFVRSGVWILSPETLQFSFAIHRIRRWRPNFLVVDECHCLWEWGQGFRPSFSLIPPMIREHGLDSSLWLTATLPFEARRQLKKALPLDTLEIGRFALSPYLQLLVEHCPWEQRVDRLLQRILSEKGFGIVFVSTREATYRLTRLIGATGKRVLPYHGGMSVEERRNTESLIRQNIPEVIVATSAFGMGMDYSHLDYAILWQAPSSLLALVQAVGRVGRNIEKTGKGIVLWDLEDFHLLEWTIQESEQRREELKSLVAFLESTECRVRYLQKYFDRLDDSSFCNQCDVCLNERTLMH